MSDPKVEQDGWITVHETSVNEQKLKKELEADGDALLARMQTPEAKEAVEALMKATPEELGQAAVEGAKKRIRPRLGRIPFNAPRNGCRCECHRMNASGRVVMKHCMPCC